MSINQWMDKFSSVAQSCPILCDPMNHSTPGLPVHHQLQSLLKLMSIESVMLSNHLILCWPLLLPASIFPSVRVFSNESVLRIKWPNYWSVRFSISPSNEYSSFCVDVCFHFSWEYTRSRISGSHGDSVISFWGTGRVFSEVAAPFYHPINKVGKFQFLHILINTCCLSFWL